MKTFTISARVTVSTYTKVQADTLEEAIELAAERDFMEIPPNNYYTEDKFWMVDEIDGTAYDLHEE